MQKILMVTEGKAGAESAICILRTMFKAPDSAVVVRVNRPVERFGAEIPVPDDEGIIVRCRRVLANSGAVKERLLDRDGDVSREILKVAHEEGVDLIIIGRGKWFRRIFTRDAMKEVERYAAVPVLVGRTGDRGKSYFSGWRGEYAA